jgi:hypothetical protein
MLRVGHHLARRSLFHNLPSVQHSYAIAHFAGQGDVMGDE